MALEFSEDKKTNARAFPGTPIMADNDCRLYYMSMPSLAYMQSGYERTNSEYPNHYVMVFDLTSTLDASHEFIQLELSSSLITVQLQFSDQYCINLYLGDISSTSFIDPARRVSKSLMLRVGENERSRTVSPSIARCKLEIPLSRF